MKPRCAEYPNCCDEHHQGGYAQITPDANGSVSAIECGLEIIVRHRKKSRLPRWKIKMQGKSCYWCGGLGGTIDHLIPTCKGGKNRKDNCVPACRRCNGLKGDMLPQEFRLKVKSIRFIGT